MNNENFLLMTDGEKNEKLTNALSEKTDNSLTEEEVRIILDNISLNRQYLIKPYPDAVSFLEALALSDHRDCQILFGNRLEAPFIMFDETHSAAVITKTKRDGKVTDVIYLYVPQS